MFDESCQRLGLLFNMKGEIMEEKINIKGIVIEILITSILTFCAQCIFLTLNYDSGKVEIIQTLNNNGEYNVFIGIRNFESDEYIEDICIELTKNIKMKDINISTDNIQYSDNMFKIKQILPNTTASIYFVSEKEITNNELKVIKNGTKLRIESLDNETAVNGTMIILALVYIGISAIITFISSYLSEKKTIARELISKRECEFIEKKLETVEERLEMREKEMEKQREHLLYNYVEIKDLTKENDFYRNLLQEIIKDGEKRSSKNIEKKITDTLKTFSTDNNFTENYEKLKFMSKKIQELAEITIK